MNVLLHHLWVHRPWNFSPKLWIPTLTIAFGLGMLVFYPLPKSGLKPGGPALDIAFWTSIFASAIFSFRMMEQLFRTGDARILSPFPIPHQTLFHYRWLAGMAEIGLWSLVAAVFFLPMVHFQGLRLYFSALWIWGSALVTTFWIGLGVLLYAGESHLHGRPGMDVYGSASFVMAPGVAFGFSAFLILIHKLTAQECLKNCLGPGVRFGLLVTWGTSLLSLIYAYRIFSTSFSKIFAHFLQDDLMVVEPQIDYFQSQSWAGLSPSQAWIQKDIVQYNRRFLLEKFLTWAFGFALMSFLWAKGVWHIPKSLLLLIPLWVTVGWLNPWLKLKGLDMGLPWPVVRHWTWAFRSTALLWMRNTLPLFLLLGLGIWLGSDWAWWEVLLFVFNAWIILLGFHPWALTLASISSFYFYAGALLFSALILALASLSPFLVFPFAIFAYGAGYLFLRFKKS